jgi:hypothetical protein
LSALVDSKIIIIHLGLGKTIAHSPVGSADDSPPIEVRTLDMAFLLTAITRLLTIAANLLDFAPVAGAEDVTTTFP